MPIYKQLPRTKPKHADELVTWAHKTVRWIEANWRVVLVGIVAVILLSAGALGARAWLIKRHVATSERLYNALKLPLDEKIKSLEVLINGSGKVASLARLKLGDALYERGDYQGVEEVLSPLKKSRNMVFKTLAYHNIASALKAKGDFAGAAKVLREVAEEDDNPVRGRSYLMAGVALMEGGLLDEAREAFNTLHKADFTTPEQKDECAKYLLWIDTQEKFK